VNVQYCTIIEAACLNIVGTIEASSHKAKVLFIGFWLDKRDFWLKNVIGHMWFLIEDKC